MEYLETGGATLGCQDVVDPTELGVDLQADVCHNLHIATISFGHAENMTRTKISSDSLTRFSVHFSCMAL
jgi:hypothetical protein